MSLKDDSVVDQAATSFLQFQSVPNLSKNQNLPPPLSYVEFPQHYEPTTITSKITNSVNSAQRIGQASSSSSSLPIVSSSSSSSSFGREDEFRRTNNSDSTTFVLFPMATTTTTTRTCASSLSSSSHAAASQQQQHHGFCLQPRNPKILQAPMLPIRGRKRPASKSFSASPQQPTETNMDDCVRLHNHSHNSMSDPYDSPNRCSSTTTSERTSGRNGLFRPSCGAIESPIITGFHSLAIRSPQTNDSISFQSSSFKVFNGAAAGHFTKVSASATEVPLSEERRTFRSDSLGSCGETSTSCFHAPAPHPPLSVATFHSLETAGTTISSFHASGNSGKSSPKIVPLTVLTHSNNHGDSKPSASPRTLPPRPGIMHLLPTSSLEGLHTDTPKLPPAESKEHQHPFSASSHSTSSSCGEMNMLSSPPQLLVSPFGTPSRSSRLEQTPRSAKDTPLPKFTLTPRSMISPNRRLPRFPSPTENDDNHDDLQQDFQINEFIFSPRTAEETTLRQCPTSEVDVSLLSEDPEEFGYCRSPAMLIEDAAATDSPKKKERFIPYPDFALHSPPSFSAAVAERTTNFYNKAFLHQPTLPGTPGTDNEYKMRPSKKPPTWDEVVFHDQGACADDESLSDNEEDEFLLVIPSTIAEEKDSIARFSKQRRLSSGHPPLTSLEHRASLCSVSSSMASLRGIDFCPSSLSLRGLGGCVGYQQPSTGLNREESYSSIGLTLEPASSDEFYKASHNRDLVTPPLMALAPTVPPPNPPRFGFSNSLSPIVKETSLDFSPEKSGSARHFRNFSQDFCQSSMRSKSSPRSS